MKKIAATFLVIAFTSAVSTASTPVVGAQGGSRSPYDSLTVLAATGSLQSPTTGIDVLQGSGERDRGITVVMQEGSAEGIRIEKRQTGAFMAFYEVNPATGRPHLRPSTRIGDGGQFETGKWMTISGNLIQWGTTEQDAGVYYLPASSRLRQGQPFSWRPSMLTVWADVETAAEFRTFNAPGGYTIALLDQDTGEELAGFDRYAQLRAGPGGRANHDVSFGRVAGNTWGMRGSLRLDSGPVLPDPVEAGFGALRAHRGPSGEMSLVISDGTSWRPVTLGAPIPR